MKFAFAILLSVITHDRIDYLPGAGHPWYVYLDKKRRPERGRTLIQAIWRHYQI